MTEQRREAETLVAGERTTTPVSGTSLDPNRMMVRRGIAVCALVAFGAFFIWGGWIRSKAGSEEKSTKPVVSQRAAYEAPREPDPPAPRREPPAQYAALGPVVRPFSEQPARSPADDLLDSARRAPVLVYNRPPRNAPPAGPALAGADLPYAGALPTLSGQRSPVTNSRISSSRPR